MLSREIELQHSSKPSRISKEVVTGHATWIFKTLVKGYGAVLAGLRNHRYRPGERGEAFPKGKGKKDLPEGEFGDGTRQPLEISLPAPKGETDGLILNDGTFVHSQPHLADRFTGESRTRAIASDCRFHGRRAKAR